MAHVPLLTRKRADIEGLRGIAILMVILYHARVPFVPGGFIGVDVFFALSGYLITSLLLAEMQRSGAVNFVNFYGRRAKRLLPASAVVVLATVVATWFLLSPLDQRTYTGTAVASSLYASNIWFAFNATDYLAAPPDTNPFLHMWSLAVEEQFYLVWPLLIWVTGRLAASRMKLTMLTLFGASFAFTLYLQATGSNAWAFFGSPARAWEFCAGGLGAVAITGLRPAAAWLGALALAVPAFAYGSQTLFPGIAALPPVLGTVAILASQRSALHRVLESRALQWFGKLSYSWYLWHWPVLVIARTMAPDLGVWGGLACSVLALGLSWLTFIAIEAPIRESPRLTRNPRLSVSFAGVVTVALLGAVWLWRAEVVTSIRDPRLADYQAARRETPAVYDNGCHLELEATEIVPCVFGDEQSKTTIVLWGDSHAAQWFPAIERAATASAWRLVSMTKSGCPPADLRAGPWCDQWRRDAIERIRRSRPALVLLVNASIYVDGEDPRLPNVTADSFRQAERRTLEQLLGVPTAIVLPIPKPGFDVPMCLARAVWHPWLANDCAFAKASPTAYALEREAAVGQGVSFLDMTNVVCLSNPCEPVSDGQIIYRDNHHLTRRFSERLAPAIGDAIADLLGDWRSDRLVVAKALGPVSRSGGEGVH